MTDIVLVRSNSVIYDPRVGKIVRSLSKNNSIVALGWNRENISPEIIKNYAVNLKLFPMKAPFGKSSLVFYLPFFWIWIFFKLIAIRPLIVHTCDFDTALPSYMYKILFRKKLVFDVFDRYAMAFLPNKGALSSLVNKFEEFFARNSDMFITVSHTLLETFRKKPEHSAIIMNCLEDDHMATIKPNLGSLILVYTGIIQRKRGLERITEAIKGLDGVKLFVAGRIIDEDFFQQITQLPNVEYKGLLVHNDALKLEANSDVMISLYDLTVPNYKYAMPNKTLEAMMLGLPLITNVALDTIDETRCGFIVDYNDLNQIKTAITDLRDNVELRKKLGENGRKAFEKKYNWNAMEQELYKIYDGLSHK